MKGLSTYSQIAGAQERGKRLESLAGTEKQKAEMDRLSASENPEDRKLYGQLNPQGALAQEKLQTQRDQDFLKGVAGSHLMLEGSSREEKAKFWAERDAGIKKKGLKAGRIEKLANLYNDGSEESAALADRRAEGYYKKAVAMGLIEPPQGQKLLAIERESQILNDPNADPEMKAAIRSKWAGSNQSIEYSPDGGFKMVTGRGVVSSKVSKRVVGSLQQKQAQNMRSIANLDSTMKLMDEQYLTYKGRFKGWASAELQKMGVDIGPEYKKSLKDISKFKARSLMGLSQFLNDLSGAAINAKEAERLKGSYPHPGDSYDKFIGKYEAITDELKQRNRIYNKLVREGFKGDTAREVTERFTVGKDDTAADRAADLEAQGLDIEEIEKSLYNEGYSY